MNFMEENDPPDRILTSQQRFEDFAMGAAVSTKRKQVTIDSIQPKKAAAGSVNTDEGRVNSGESVSLVVNSNTNMYIENSLKEYKVLVNVSKAYAKDKLVSKNEVFFYERIEDLNVNGIKIIKKLNLNTFRIIFLSASHANNFVSALNASNKDMFAFIPISFINSYGVVRNIPIKSIYRFQRRDVDKPGILLPTFSIKI